MKPYRSMLFVPGHKASWADKGIASGADALILDLEDSVPADAKDEARKVVRDTIGRLCAQGVRADLWVRPNSMDSGLFGADVEQVIVPGLAGLFLPKVFTAREIVGIDAVVTHIEQRDGLIERCGFDEFETHAAPDSSAALTFAPNFLLSSSLFARNTG